MKHSKQIDTTKDMSNSTNYSRFNLYLASRLGGLSSSKHNLSTMKSKVITNKAPVGFMSNARLSKDMTPHGY